MSAFLETNTTRLVFLMLSFALIVLTWVHVVTGEQFLQMASMAFAFFFGKSAGDSAIKNTMAALTTTPSITSTNTVTPTPEAGNIAG